MPIRKETWQQALDSQTACNLSGLAHSLLEFLAELRDNGINSTDALNTHPLVRLVVAQMAYLAFGSFDCGDGTHWQRAYDLAAMELGWHPFYDRPLEDGERESFFARWAIEDKMG